jgi:excinuclease ABC subunit A
MPESRLIIIKGAKEHNLKNINLNLPRNKLIVFSGLSGSGKSSLAFDTIYAEGQRRYVESLSAYARQFLGQMEKPNVDHIEGLSPAISIDQKSGSSNPRSTVGTTTEIYDYLRLLYARVGKQYCPDCNVMAGRQSSSQIVELIANLEENTLINLLSPVVRGRKGTYEALLVDLAKQGFLHAVVDNKVIDLSEVVSDGEFKALSQSSLELKRYQIHDIFVVVDRLRLRKDVKKRLTDSVQSALRLSGGTVIVQVLNEKREVQKELFFSQYLACPKCFQSFQELEPRSFSFNSPYGACESCSGLGYNYEVHPDLVVPNGQKSIRQGAIEPFSGGHMANWQRFLEAFCESVGINLDTPFNKLKKQEQKLILYGGKDISVSFAYRNRFNKLRTLTRQFPGVIPWLNHRYQTAESETKKEELRSYMREVNCSACEGSRLKLQARFVKVADLSLPEVVSISVEELYQWVKSLKFSDKDAEISREIIKELSLRLKFLLDVGLGYLTLGRSSRSLSGGEAQRIRLASQIGSGLTGVLYVLDEPSIGLHQRDNKKLLSTLKHLRDLGNTVIVVEHDEETIRSADYVVDIGPLAGEAGGKVVATGTPKEIELAKNSITGQYLRGVKQIRLPKTRRKPTEFFTVEKASLHNLKGQDASFPYNCLICVTGVSGSGKSSLVMDVLLEAFKKKLSNSTSAIKGYKDLRNYEKITRVIEVDQSPIGRTPRSNPATYTKAFDAIREIFAMTPESRIRGYKPGRFSFNVPGGRCESCQGDGLIKIEMQFLPDVYVNCDECNGTRYNRETLEIYFKGANISDVLNMSVSGALKHFEGFPKVTRWLKTLQDVGLGYIKLGQPATTLSGGEAQRIKLASELAKRSNSSTLYVLDEPTTGLHFDDVHKLLMVFQKLVDQGNTIIIIEHNLDVIKCADWIIDLGPEGGDNGGYIIAQGPPEQIIKAKNSYTGMYLKKYL